MKSLVVLTACLLTSISQAEELCILAWNVESDGNNPNVIVSQLYELSGYDIVGLTEVRASSIKKYVDALSASGNTFLSVNTAIFVAGPAHEWQAKSWVVVRPGDFPDSDETSDHRPVAVAVELPVGQ